MAAPDSPPLRRRFVTRVDVEDAHRAGAAVTLGPTDVITHEAAQRAADLEVQVIRPSRPTPPTASGAGPAAPGSASSGPAAPGPAAPGSASSGSDLGRLRAAVRAAVVAELGTEPPGLDAAIDTVLARRQS